MHWNRLALPLALAALGLAGSCGATSQSPPRPAVSSGESSESVEVIAPSVEASAEAPEPEATAQDRFLHRFGVARVRGDGSNEYHVIARPAPDDATIALVSYDGALSIGGERIDGGYRDFAVVKLDARGEVEWVYSLEGADEQVSRYANALVVSDDGEVFVGGVFGDQSPGFSLLRLSPEGRQRWLRSPTRGGMWSEIHDMAVDSSGNVVVAGHYSSRLTIDGLPSQRCSTGCGFVASFDGDRGDARWVGHLRSPDGAYVGVEATNDDDVIVAGHFGTAARVGDIRLHCRGELDLILARYSREGVLQWAVKQGGRGREELVRMVGLSNGQVILQSTTEVLVANESDGSLHWRGPLQPGQQLVESSHRRGSFWLASLEERSDGTSTIRFSINDADGEAQQVGALHVESSRFQQQLRPALSQRALVVGGVIGDRRWDATPDRPFVLQAPLMAVLDETRIESLSQRGVSGGTRCAPENRLPSTPDLFELRAGLEVVRTAVRQCGVNLRSLRFELNIDGDGTVTEASPRVSLPMAQRVCVCEALESSRFCPFFSASYVVETAFQ